MAKQTNFNREAVDRIDQAHGARIVKLFWIAGSLEDHDFLDYLLEDNNAVETALPEIFNSKHYPNYVKDGRDGMIEALVDHSKFGFLAEIHIPDHRGFSFNKGPQTIDNVSGCSVHEGIMSIDYVYAESQLALLDEIEKAATRTYNEQFKRWLKEQKKTPAKKLVRKKIRK